MWAIAVAALCLAIFALGSKKGRFAVLAIALLMGSAMMSLRQQSLESSAIKRYLGTSVHLRAQIVTDPSMTNTAKYSFLARALTIETQDHLYKLRIPIRILTSDASVTSLLPGQIISGDFRVVSSKEGRVAALALMESTIVIETPPSNWALLLGGVRLGLRQISGDGDSGALIPGMVLGDTSKQSAEFKVAMKRSGLMHLVAVSGANFAIISGFVLWGAQFLIPRMRWRLGATAIFLIAFIALVRPSPSVLRAAAMAAVMLLAISSKRPRDSLPALGFAIAAVVMADPWQARDAGFALSVLATAGLLLFAPILIARLSSKVPSLVAHALAIPIAAILFCSPVLVALSGYLSPMSIVANVLAAPAVVPITILGFIAALIAPVFPVVATLIVALIRIPAAFIASVAHWAAGFPVISLETGRVGFIIVAALIALIWGLKKFRKVLVAAILALIIALALFQRFPAAGWDVVQCDVGQGDSLVINLGSQSAVVIDVGPDAALVDACLKSLGVEKISLLILTHFHADHVDGLAGLLKSRSVSQIWISNNNDPQAQSSRVKSLLQSSELRIVRRGMSAKVGNLAIKVLWPDSGVQLFEPLPGQGSTANNSSIAIWVASPDFTLFAGGDIEPPVQAQLMDDISRVDIYKVSHHGSAYQDLRFMEVLNPAAAVISVGAGNSYGHPAPKTIAALNKLGALVYRTDTDGAIAITARSHQLSVRRSKAGFKFFRLG